MAHGQVRSALEGGDDADAELGHGGAQGDNGQSDDYLRHAEPLGHGHRPFGESVGTPKDEHHAHHDPQSI